jgi:hypothetical protein
VIIGEDFNDNSRDSAKWSLGLLNEGSSAFDNLVTVLEQNQRLQINPRAKVNGLHYNGYTSLLGYDFTGARASIQVIQAASGAADTAFALATDSNNWYRFIVEGGKLYFQAKVNGVKSSSAITYNATTHKFWRLRHEAVNNTILWETSTDGTAWTLRNSVARQIPITALHVDIDSGTFQSVTTPGAAIFDNFKLER